MSMKEQVVDLASGSRAIIDARDVSTASESLAVQAAGIVLTAREFGLALRPALALKAHVVTGATIDWLMTRVSALPDAVVSAEDKGAILDTLRGATTFERADPDIDRLGAALGFTPAEIDALFLAAAQGGA